MEPDALTPGSSPYYDFVYNNESTVAPTYWPLVISQLQTKRAANELYTDDPTQYITYSGSWQSLLVAREKEGRYRNFSIRAYSGDSFNFYISLPSGESSVYYSGPLTTSGNYSVLTEYASEGDAQISPVVFQSPQDNAQVYTLPSVKAVDWIRLHHESVVSGQAYRIYQFLPRTLIQVDDLEADVIDAVTIRVQDSIVIGPDMIGDKTILGQKIVDGTLSGILLADGTITGSKVQANTISGVLITGGTITGDKIVANTISGELITAGAITADKLNVTSLSAVNTNTGSLNVTGTITVSGASSEIDAGLTKIDQTGITIGSINTSLPLTNALRIYGSGSAFNVVGAAFYNGAFSSSTPLFQVQLDGTGTVEFEHNKFGDAAFHFNFPSDSVSNTLRVFNGSIDLRSSSSVNPDAPGIAGYTNSSVVMYELNHDGAYFAGDVGIGTSSPSYKLHVVGDTFSTNLYASIGDTAASPSHSWASDPDTGMYHVTTDTLGFSTNGQESARITSNNVLTVNGTNQNGQITVEVPDGTARSTLTLRQLNDPSVFINFVGNSSAGTTTPINTAAVGTYRGKVRVAINGVTRWIPFYD